MKNVSADRRRTRRASLGLCLLIASGLILVAAANAHLVYVANLSQPPCVVHLRQGETADQRGRFAAAESSCASPLSPAPAYGRE